MIQAGPESFEPSAGRLPITDGHFAEFAADPAACMRRLQQTHGEIAALREGAQTVIFVFGPHYNREILSDPVLFHSRFFGIRGPRRSAQRRLTSGLLSMNDEVHKRHRRLLMSAFSRKSIDSYHGRLVEATETMLAEWRPGQVRDIYRDMTGLMLHITSAILFGFDHLDLACDLGRMIERWVAMNHELGIGALVPDDNFTNRYDELLAQADELEQRILRMIQLRRSQKTEANDVLSILVRAHDEQGGLTDEELIGQACVLFGAAHLTSANTLSWTLLLLAQHPEIMAALCDELHDTLGGRAPQLNEVDQMPLLDRVVRESMRVLPASSYSQRANIEPVDLGPFRLVPGTTIVFSPFITHHLSDLYEAPEAFRPDRWLGMEQSPYAYLPFGAGPRMCMGATLAMMTFKVALPTILQRFRLSAVPNSDICGLVKSTMLTPTTPLWLKLDRQDGRFESHPIQGNIHELVELPAPSRCVARCAEQMAETNVDGIAASPR
ncbi:MAG: cytochrome P450 [Planctomycetia bacterium]|nr:cytochrome P450 [Planctomycetia bacterium]